MMKWIAISLFCAGLLHAEIPSATFNYNLSGGFRQDQISMSLHHHHKHHKLISKVEWEDLKMAEIKGQFSMVACNYVYMRASGDYAWIQSGENKIDGTHGFDLAKKTGTGNAFDYSAAFGWQFPFCGEQLLISPVVGYACHEQNLQGAKNLKKDKHRYRLRWHGAFGGADLTYRLTCDWLLFGTYEYHWNTHFRGKGHLSSGFLHSEHLKERGRGSGTISTVGTSYAITDCVTLGIAFDYQTFRAHEGGHHRSKCHQHRKEKKRHEPGSLKRAKWQSYDLLASLQYIY